VDERTAELAAALTQQTAIAELVQAMSRTSFQLEALLHTLIENVTQLCHADQGFVYLRDGEDYVMRVNHGAPSGRADLQPLRPAMGSLAGELPCWVGRWRSTMRWLTRSTRSRRPSSDWGTAACWACPCCATANPSA
jgi:hypothetical protein